MVGNNQLTGGDTYDGWLLTKKMGKGLRQIEFGLFAVLSMKATQDVGLKFLSIRPYSEATVFVNQRSTSMHT